MDRYIGMALIAAAGLLISAGVIACASGPVTAELLDDSSPGALYRSIAPALGHAREKERERIAERAYAIALERKWIPLVFDSSVVFLYRSPSAGTKQVEIRGDLNGWGANPAAPKISLASAAGTSLYLSAPLSLDSAARIDYRMVINGSDWIMDPGNGNEAWGGFGPNSSFSMPGYRSGPWTGRQDVVARGTLLADRRIASAALGCEISYGVYLPSGFDRGKKYPVLFTTDGQEYSDPKLGALPLTADSMIAAGVIEPIIIVFVDPRDPADKSRNRREIQYACNPLFASFLAEELQPRIASEFPLAGTPGSTALIGTSFGGVNSAFVGLTQSSVFGLIAVESPAIKFLGYDNTKVMQLFREKPRARLEKIWIDAGTVFDTADEARAFRALLEEKGYTGISYHEYPEGHSWGNWRERIPDILRYFFAKD